MNDNDNSAFASLALARQPIVDQHLAVMGYELLYRKNADALSADIINEVTATSQVMSTAIFGIGLNHLVGANQAFIKLPRDYLLAPSGIPFDKEKVVIEVLGNAGFDPVLLAALRRWSDAGYRIALSGVQFEPRLVPFFTLADYIKLDMRALGEKGVLEQIELCKDFNLKLTAEKVETWQEYQFCQALGMDYFQGYFFEKPEVMSSQASKVNNMTLLQIMSSLLQADLDVDDLERIVSQDAGLVHKLLRYLNSPITGLVATIDSVRLAIMLIGADQLKSITNMLLMSEMVGGKQVLLEQIMLRAKHMALYAEQQGYGNQDKYFLAGMLSMMDSCIGMSLEDVLSELPLPNEFINAILQRTGRLGETLDQIEAYGRGDQPEVDEKIQESYLSASHWVHEYLAIV